MKDRRHETGTAAPEALETRPPCLLVFSTGAWKKEIKGLQSSQLHLHQAKACCWRSLARDTFAGCAIHCLGIVSYVHLQSMCWVWIYSMCSTRVRYAAIVGQTWLSCIRRPPWIRWLVPLSLDRNPVRNCPAMDARTIVTRCKSWTNNTAAMPISVWCKEKRNLENIWLVLDCEDLWALERGSGIWTFPWVAYLAITHHRFQGYRWEEDTFPPDPDMSHDRELELTFNFTSSDFDVNEKYVFLQILPTKGLLWLLWCIKEYTVGKSMTSSYWLKIMCSSLFICNYP